MSDNNHHSIMDKSGLEVLLGTILEDLKDIKKSLKEIPSTERVNHLEIRIKSLEEIRNYLIVTVSGLIIYAVWNLIAKGGS